MGKGVGEWSASQACQPGGRVPWAFRNCAQSHSRARGLAALLPSGLPPLVSAARVHVVLLARGAVLLPLVGCLPCTVSRSSWTCCFLSWMCRYIDDLLKLKAQVRGEGIQFLTWNDIQSCVDRVNSAVHEEHESKSPS